MTAIVYRREIDGKVLTLGVSGNLLKNALVMYDREEDGLWSHFTGEGLKGPRKGQWLEQLASAPKVPWKVWREENPTTLVLLPDNSASGYSDYTEYFLSDEQGLFPPEAVAGLADPKDIILGLPLDPPRAYHRKRLEDQGVLGINIKGRAAVIFASRDEEFFGAAILPQGVDRLTLQGRRLKSANGREWSALTGKGASGDLEMLPVTPSFWFAWYDHHANTEFWPEGGVKL